MKKLLVWIIPSLALVALVIWRFSQLHQSQGAVGKQGRTGTSAEVQVITATGRLIVQTLQGVADIESPQKVEVSPKTAGRIDHLNAREGDLVVPGELLLKVDPSDLQGAMLQMQANLADAQARLAQAKLTQNSTNVGVKSQIQLQRAVLRSNQANLTQAQQDYNAEVAGAQALVTTAQSGIANAQAALDKENANLKNSQVTYDRTLNLFKQNFIASQDVDNAKTALEVEKGSVEVAQSQLQAAKAQFQVQVNNLTIAKNKGRTDIAAAKATVQESQANVRVAQANTSAAPAYQENLDALQAEVGSAADQLTEAKARLADTMIYSPIAGAVTARKADPGDLASPGTPVLEVQFLDWLYVTTTLPIDFSTQVQAGQIANITIDGLPGRIYTGPIININPAADPESRQFGIKVRLVNKDHMVRPGMYGKVSIATSRVNATVVVPKEAVTTTSTGVSTVTVVDAQGVAHVRSVTLGVSDDTGFQITNGVNPGDQVVVLTYSTLKDGQKVRISAPTGPSASHKHGPSAVVTVPTGRISK